MNKPTYEELQAQVKQLAAENAALKSNLMFWDAEDPESPYDCPEDIANNFAMDFNTEFDVQVAAKMPNRTYRVSEVGEYDCKIELVSGGMPETPATDAFLASLRAEGINFAASRLAAAYNHGFIDKPLAEVGDVVRMILTAKEDLANNPAADGLSGQYAEIALAKWESQLRSKSEVQS